MSKEVTSSYTAGWCKARNGINRETDECKRWKDAHASSCQINHHGSSDKMVALAAIEIFIRSIEQRQLKYTTFVGDGDMKEKFSDGYVVQNEECRHVQKRLGTALRQYKNNKKGQKPSDGKGVPGRGRLADKVIDKMRNYYGNAIRQNKGNLQGMKDSIKAIKHHMIVKSCPKVSIALKMKAPGASSGRMS